MNPFKFGTIVQGEFFTDRIEELEHVKQLLDSENHLVLISPRRFGKSSLIAKALQQTGRPSITIDFMKVLSTEDLAAQILSGVFRLHKMEKLKHLLAHFRIAPNISYNPMTEGWDISFMPLMEKASVALEDAMGLLQKITTPENRLIVVFDEFQEVNEISPSLAKQLRAIIQHQEGLNYVFMGSQESMMNEIFEKKKSPFYHFGQRMNLKKIPYADFFSYIVSRLPEMEQKEKEKIANEILRFTNVHPYYSQQLAAATYNIIMYSHPSEDAVSEAIKQQVDEHDLDYERLWISMKRTDRKILTLLARKTNPLTDRSLPTSTTFSAIKRLVKQGYVIKTTAYELEDPFFGEWILQDKANM
jgi:hypothetical protein